MIELPVFPVPALQLGVLTLSDTALAGLLVTALLAVAALAVRRALTRAPAGRLAVAGEAVVTAIEGAIEAVAPGQGRRLFPLIGTLWIYLVAANLIGLVPGLTSPTRDLSATAALALLVFLSTHWFAMRTLGVAAHLCHYLYPTPLLLPFHLVSEISRTVALAVRLFGNIASMETAAVLLLAIAGFLAPVPILVLHVVEGLVQAYIFGMLALAYIAGSLEVLERRRSREKR